LFRALTGLEEEVAFIAAWIDAGCPQDDVAVEAGVELRFTFQRHA
jgi:hypothetical protein